jgi:DNA-binding ferritin-like protein
MKELAVILKTLNIFAHNAHNLVSRVVFNQDHEFLGEIYSEADSNYDDVVERMIGLGLSPNLNEINMLACQKAVSIQLGQDNYSKLHACLDLEKASCQIIEQLVRSNQVSVGTEQLIGGIADKSEVRQYKLQQRLTK